MEIRAKVREFPSMEVGQRPIRSTVAAFLAERAAGRDLRIGGMAYQLDAAGQRRLDCYFDGIGAILRRRDRRESFALYALGLFGDGERKAARTIHLRILSEGELTRFLRTGPARVGGG